MIKAEEIKYLVKETIRFFKEGSECDECYYEDVAWDYARGVLEDTLDKNKKQDLYSKVIKKLNDDCKGRINLSEIMHTSDEKGKSLLLFLIDYNCIRFIMQESSERERYIRALPQAIDAILLKKEVISNNLSYENAFEYVKQLIYEKTNRNEYVATAKILMLLNPNKFIAWDSKIARRFRLRYNDDNISKSEYKKFNEQIDRFIEKNKTLVDCMVDHAGQYKIKKLLDMIFWITYNRKDVFLNCCLTSKFYNLTEKFVESYIPTNENEQV